KVLPWLLIDGNDTPSRSFETRSLPPSARGFGSGAWRRSDTRPRTARSLSLKRKPSGFGPSSVSNGFRARWQVGETDLQRTASVKSTHYCTAAAMAGSPQITDITSTVDGKALGAEGRLVSR